MTYASDKGKSVKETIRIATDGAEYRELHKGDAVYLNPSEEEVDGCGFHDCPAWLGDEEGVLCNLPREIADRLDSGEWGENVCGFVTEDWVKEGDPIVVEIEYSPRTSLEAAPAVGTRSGV